MELLYQCGTVAMAKCSKQWFFFASGSPLAGSKMESAPFMLSGYGRKPLPSHDVISLKEQFKQDARLAFAANRVANSRFPDGVFPSPDRKSTLSHMFRAQAQQTNKHSRHGGCIGRPGGHEKVNDVVFLPVLVQGLKAWGPLKLCTAVLQGVAFGDHDLRFDEGLGLRA